MKPTLGNAILAVATTVVVVSIIAGVILVGSPTTGRLEQLDSTRIDDLREIMAAMDPFWDRNERLPDSLDELTADPRVDVSNVDPGSAEPYGYEVLDETTYEVCATFDRESPSAARRTSEDFWRHGVGRQCFELTVDTSG